MDGKSEKPRSDVLPLTVKEFKQFLEDARYQEPSHEMRQNHKHGKVYDRETKQYC